MTEGSSRQGEDRRWWVTAAVVLLILDAALFVVPVAGFLVLYVIVARPDWFRRGVDRLYEGRARP